MSEELCLVWGSPDKDGRQWHTGVIPVEATRLVKGLGHTAWNRLTEQGQFGLRKEELKGAKIPVYDNIIGRHREGKARFLKPDT